MINQNTVIIFNGPPNSGKDYLGSQVAHKYGFKTREMKHLLIKETAKHFNIPYAEMLLISSDRTLKEKPSVHLNRLTPRRALQVVSEEVLKPKFGKDVISRYSVETMKPHRTYVYTDCGFTEEFETVKKAVGRENIFLIHLYAANCSFVGDTRSYIGDIPNLSLFNDKDELTVENLFDTINRFLNRKIK